jgi:RHS repeat-associated protein
MTQRQRVNDEDVDGNARQGERTYYVYDAAGERVRKVTERPDGSLKDERLYLGGFEIYRRHSGVHEGLVRGTLHLMDDRQCIALVEIRNEVDDGTPKQLVRYQLSNHLGSASLELDDAAQIISYEEYTPYGSTSFQAVRGQTEAKRYRYTGKERDEETGLEYHGARYYAPWLGRWTSCDPMEIRDGLNVYRYAQSSPISVVDPSGTEGTRVPISGATPNMSEKDITALAAKSGWKVSGYLGQDMTGTPYFEHGERMTPKEREMQEAKDLIADNFKYDGPAIGVGRPDPENAVKIESGNSSITMSEEDYEGAAFTAGMYGGQQKDDVRIYKSEREELDPNDDPEAQAAAQTVWRAEKHLEDLSTAQKIFNEVIVPALKGMPVNFIIGAAEPPPPAEEAAPHPGMSDRAVLQSYTFFANAEAEVRLRENGIPRASFGFRLFIYKGNFIQSYVGQQVAENPVASRRFIFLSRNFTEEPDVIPRTRVGMRYDFRNRTNYDFFPLNENQRTIHFNRSYGSTMIGLYYYNSRPTVIRFGR